MGFFAIIFGVMSAALTGVATYLATKQDERCRQRERRVLIGVIICTLAAGGCAAGNWYLERKDSEVVQNKLHDANETLEDQGERLQQLSVDNEELQTAIQQERDNAQGERDKAEKERQSASEEREKAEAARLLAIDAEAKLAAAQDTILRETLATPIRQVGGDPKFFGNKIVGVDFLSHKRLEGNRKEFEKVLNPHTETIGAIWLEEFTSTSKADVGQEDIEQLADRFDIVELDIRASNFTDYRFLAKFSNLRRLYVGRCKNLDNADIKAICSIDTLEVLDLGFVNGPGLTDDCIEDLENHKKLRRLSIQHSFLTANGQIEREDVSALANAVKDKFPALEELLALNSVLNKTLKDESNGRAGLKLDAEFPERAQMTPREIVEAQGKTVGDEDP